jgi:pimeloyl-ACP methyl ester carboxylesterase
VTARSPNAVADDAPEAWIPIGSGLELHVIRWEPEIGQRPPDVVPTPFLLVHGLASNARLWDGVGRRLAAAGHLAIAVDQRGHGRSTKPDHGYDMATVADDLALLIDAVGLERPFVVGQSWGGNVVLELAVRHATAISAIACVDGGFIDLRSRFADWDEAATALAPPPLLGTPLDQITAWLEASTADWPPEGRRGTLASFDVRDDGTIAPWLTFDRHLEVLRGMWEHEPSARYPLVDVPVLFIPADTGDGGWNASKRVAVDAALDALHSGRVEWFSPAHHDVHAQQPAEVADLLHRAATDPTFFPAPRRASALPSTEREPAP